jgi:TRAP-type C4-dicarboxylate transport system permease small subunit
LADRADRLARAVETFLLVLVLGTMIVLAATQIALRNIWGTGFDWADEALRILVLWVTVLGAVAASRERRHVRIDALSRYLSSVVTRRTAVLIDAFTAVVCAALAWYSYQFVAESWLAGDRVLGGKVPAWSVQLILPVGFALISFRYALACLRRPDTKADYGAVP